VSHLIGMPRTVRIFCTNHRAWIVGSAAAPIHYVPGSVQPRDWDVMVPWDVWHLAAAHVPEDAVRNTYGGWKFEEDGVTIDVWPDTLERLAVSHFFTCAYQPCTGVRIVKEIQGCR
jgi:hypothetical protein